MIPRTLQVPVWRAVRHTWRGVLALTAALLIAALVFRWYRGIGSLEDTRSRVMLTLIGLSVGAWMASILIAGARRYTLVALAGLGGLLASQVFYLMLVWAELKPEVWLWRAWWTSWVVAVTLTHHVWSRFTRVGAENWVGRATAASGVTAGALLVLLAFRYRLLDEFSPPYLILLGVALVLTVVGSLVLWVAAKRRRARAPVSRWQKLGWVLGAQAAMFGFGFYSGRVTAPTPGACDTATSPLAHLSPAELESQTSADLARLKVIAAGIDKLAAESAEFSARIRQAKEAEGRSYYTPAEEDALRAQFMTYLAYRSALLRMVAAYASHESVPDPRARARCFLVGYGAGATVMRGSVMLVTTYGADETVRRKLNEPDDSCGLRPGEFDRIEGAVVSNRNAEMLQQVASHYATHRDGWQTANLLPPAEFAWLTGQIDRCEDHVRAAGIDRSRTKLARLVERVRQDVGQPVYSAQSLVSTLIGDTRMVKRPPFITHEQVLAMQPQLRPGDILLERRNWFMSNAFLPGFWPHAALYVGTVEDLEQLGLVRNQADGTYTSDEPAIRDRLDEFLRGAVDHEPNTVIESVSEGVIFNSLTHSMGADYVAVLRPRRLSDADRARAIARAFAHVGKPYDFEFDFFSADKLVCTELVYRSYQGMLHFDLVRIMGRDTLPALEICRKFAAERSRPDEHRELDFVLFLDAVPAERRAALADEIAFCASADRPRGFNE